MMQAAVACFALPGREVENCQSLPFVYPERLLAGSDTDLPGRPSAERGCHPYCPLSPLAGASQTAVLLWMRARGLGHLGRSKTAQR